MDFTHKLFKLHKKDPSQQTWEASVGIQRNKVTSLKCRGMKSFCMNASVSTKHHDEFWGKMKPLLPNTRGKSQNTIVLVDSERMVTDPLSVTETFSE